MARLTAIDRRVDGDVRQEVRIRASRVRARESEEPVSAEEGRHESKLARELSLLVLASLPLEPPCRGPRRSHQRDPAGVHADGRPAWS